MRSVIPILVAVGTTSVVSGQGGTVELRLMPGAAAADWYSPGSVAEATPGSVVLDPAKGITTTVLELQARVVDDPNAIGVAALGVDVLGDEGHGGLFERAPLTFCEQFQLCDDPISQDATAFTGMFPDFRGVIGPNNDWLDNGIPVPDGLIEIIPLSIVLAPNSAGQDWGTLYKFSFTTTDATARSFDVNVPSTAGPFGGYTAETSPGVFEFIQPQPVVSPAPFQISIIPAPGAAFAIVAMSVASCARRRR